MKVLVTRPAYAAKALCDKMLALNFTPECLPTIEVFPTPNQTRLKETIAKLDTMDILIFVSRPAAYFGMRAIQEYWQARWKVLPGLLWSAVGPGTAKVLRDHGVTEVLLPTHQPYETESLLEITALQNVAGKNITIFRGNNGRSLMIDTLKKRGALLTVTETYQRRLPNIELSNILTTWKYQPQSAIDLIITTSAESLHNLILLMGPEIIEELKLIPIVVVGSRMYDLALGLGFRRPLLSAGADEQSLLATLQAFKKGEA